MLFGAGMPLGKQGSESGVQLTDAGEFDVHRAAESCVEQQIPTRVVVVVLDVNIIAIPIPIAAVRDIIGRDDPVEAIVERDDKIQARVRPSCICSTGCSCCFLLRLC
jgi:hypothetical protein